MLDMDTTETIDVQVETQYLPEQSMVDEERYMFSYTITITNQSELSAQLISRSWLITDSKDTYP